MSKLVNFMGAGLLWGLLTTVAAGQTPTYSIEAVEVNGIPIPGGPTNHIAISHGDVLTAKLFIRDWSPNGEKLRAYQIKIDDASYATGNQGVVQPVDFQMNPEKDPNAFIDESDSQWVHRGQPTIPLTDSVSPGYRWLSVLLDPYGGPVSAQDGKKYSCGTVKLTPTPNAKGTFNIAMVEESYASYLLSTENEQILPIEYERLTVDVEATERWRRLLSSDPPNGSVDARQATKSGATGGPWTAVRLSFNSDCSTMKPDDFTVQDETANPPRIQKVSSEGSTLSVTLDRPIRSDGWTTITHKNSGTRTRIGRIAGDVDNDGTVDSRDLLTLLDAVNGGRKLPDYQADIDGNGTLGPGDVLQLLDLITESRGKARPRAGLGKTGPNPPKSP